MRCVDLCNTLKDIATVRITGSDVFEPSPHLVFSCSPCGDFTIIHVAAETGRPDALLSCVDAAQWARGVISS